MQNLSVFFQDVKGRQVSVLEPGISIALPLNFDVGAPQVSAYQVQRAYKTRVCTANRKLGINVSGANCHEYHFIPHCHSTHTEVAGHLTLSGNPTIQQVFDVQSALLIPAILITIHPDAGKQKEDDVVITQSMIVESFNQQICESLDKNNPNKAIILRVNYQDWLDNPYQQYQNPPYFTDEAASWLSEQCQHLVTNLPSVDKEKDQGKLENHRLFFMLGDDKDPQKLFEKVKVNEPKQIKKQFAKSITELAYLPCHIPDGEYALQLGVMRQWYGEAAPSSPMLFKIESI